MKITRKRKPCFRSKSIATTAIRALDPLSTSSVSGIFTSETVLHIGPWTVLESSKSQGTWPTSLSLPLLIFTAFAQFAINNIVQFKFASSSHSPSKAYKCLFSHSLTRAGLRSVNQGESPRAGVPRCTLLGLNFQCLPSMWWLLTTADVCEVCC